MELNFGQDFSTAVKNEEFKVFYQPKVSLHDYRLIGAEALCRWFHNGIIIPPDSFIPYLEQTGDICQLDFYMLDHVCRDLEKWLAEGLRCVKVSVNLSRRHEINENLLNKILQIIDSHKIPHEYIEIELVETHNDMSFSALKQIVTSLKENNISTSVDDFGIGYSSLNLIRDLPWDILKIDKSFLPENSSNRRQHIMLKHVIAMAQDLGLDCIVEGVETIEQIKLLKEYNCYMAQGYFFDKPLPRDEFTPKLKR
ncbi:MAG: EAL domain-containing protein [Treponema sp.]|nr:EAL domain-containing protein [Treponema sp.]